MFGLSLPEILVVLAVILIAFGPERLPELARKFGKMSADLRRSSETVRREFYNAMYQPADEIKSALADSTRELRTLGHEVMSVPKSEKSEPVTEDSTAKLNTESAEVK